MVFQGIWWAGYLLVPFVLAKSLDASEALISLAVAMDTGSMFLALYWGQLLSRGRRRAVTLWGGVAGRLVLLLSFLTTTAASFMVLLAVVYFFGSLVYPAQNGILQENFRPRMQGRIWGLASSLQNFVAVGTSLIVGRILDHDPGLYRSVYAGIGACGFVYLLLLSRLWQPAAAAGEGWAAETGGERTTGVPAEPAGFPERGRTPLAALTPEPRVPAPLPVWELLAAGHLLHGLVQPFREAVATFRRDRGYLWYEVNFMIYGLAFLMIYTMLPILLAGQLRLSYEQISTARIVIAQSGVALLAPWMGQFSDRHHPARLCQLAFAVMSLFPLGLIAAHDVQTARPDLAIDAVFVIYAVGMAGVNIGWNVGSISFAPAGEGSRYQGIHVAMVGIRGLLGPVIGLTAYRVFGMNQVFLLACVLLLLASISSDALCRWLARVRGAAPS